MNTMNLLNVNPVRTTSMTLAEIRAKLAELEAELKARGG